MRSTNRRRNLDSYSQCLEVSCFGFGAAAPGQSIPSIYIVGYVNNVYGIWQSNNDTNPVMDPAWVDLGTQQ